MFPITSFRRKIAALYFIYLPMMLLIATFIDDIIHLYIINKDNTFIISLKVKLIARANFIDVSPLTLTLIARLKTRGTWRRPLSSRNVRRIYRRPGRVKNPRDPTGEISDPNSPHGRR